MEIILRNSYFLQISVPLSMDEIPSLPEPEGSLLKEQLKQVNFINNNTYKTFINVYVLFHVYFRFYFSVENCFYKFYCG